MGRSNRKKPTGVRSSPRAPILPRVVGAALSLASAAPATCVAASDRGLATNPRKTIVLDCKLEHGIAGGAADIRSALRWSEVVHGDPAKRDTKHEEPGDTGVPKSTLHRVSGTQQQVAEDQCRRER